MAFARHQQSKVAFVGEIKATVTIEQGGSSATTAQSAVENIGGMSVSLIGAPNGVLGLDSKGKVPKENDPRIFDTIAGPKSLIPGNTGVYEITNYDSKRIYLVTSDDGTVSRNNALISFTPYAGNLSDFATFVVNNRFITIPLNATLPLITKPSIVQPANNSTVSPKYAVFESSVFKTLDNALKHKATDWRIGNNSSFSTLLHQETVTEGHMTRLFVGSTVLIASTDFYISVRYRADNQETGSEVVSSWSDPIKFSKGVLSAISKEVGQIVSGTPTTDGFFGKVVTTASAADDSILTAVADFANSCVDIYRLSKLTNLLTLEKRITSPSADISLKYAISATLSPDGTFLAVSAPGFKTGTPIKGAVYLYERGAGKTWDQIAILEGSNSSGFVTADYKSIAVSTLANRVVAAEPLYDSGQGKAVVFVKNVSSWTPYSLTVPTAYASYGQAMFGKDVVAVSPNSNKIAISCRTAADTFSLLVFKANGSNWDFEGSVGPFRFQGSQLASQGCAEFNDNGTKLVVGIPTAVSVNNEIGGRASVWSFASSSNWTKEAELYEHGLNIKSAGGYYAGSLYGQSVAFSSTAQNLILVGSPGYDSDDVNKNIGRVFSYAYAGGKWVYSGFYSPSNEADEDKFGFSVSCTKDAEALCIAAPGTDTDVGSVFLYR